MARSKAPLQRALRLASPFAVAALLCAFAGLLWPERAAVLGYVAGGLMLVFAVVVLVGLAKRQSARP